MGRLKVTVWTWGETIEDPDEEYVSAWVSEKGLEEIVAGDERRFGIFVVGRGCFNPDAFDEDEGKWIPGKPEQLVFDDDPIKFCLNVPNMYSNSTYFWMTVEDEDGKSVLAPPRAAQRMELLLPDGQPLVSGGLRPDWS